MPKTKSFDVESYRNPYESNTEWGMRKKFLLAHHKKLDIDRLICLSNCYVNVEIYGCRYHIKHYLSAYFYKHKMGGFMGNLECLKK